jgi:hypothetical protein
MHRAKFGVQVIGTRRINCTDRRKLSSILMGRIAGYIGRYNLCHIGQIHHRVRHSVVGQRSIDRVRHVA